jgi:hypothetical protein
MIEVPLYFFYLLDLRESAHQSFRNILQAQGQNLEPEVDQGWGLGLAGLIGRI